MKVFLTAAVYLVILIGVDVNGSYLKTETLVWGRKVLAKAAHNVSLDDVAEICLNCAHDHGSLSVCVHLAGSPTYGTCSGIPLLLAL